MCGNNNTLISYFCPKEEMYILANKGPIQIADSIPKNALENGRIKLRVRKMPSSEPAPPPA